MWQAFKDASLEALGSKKFLVLIASCGAWIALRLGWHVDEATIETYLKFVLTPYLVGQGIADHGKGAAQVQAKMQARLSTLQPTNANTPPPAVQKQAGFSTLGLMIVLAVVSAIAISCAAVTKWTNAFTSCTKQNLGQIVASTQKDIEQSVVDVIDGNVADIKTQITNLATEVGLDAVDCALVAIAEASGSAGSDAPATADKLAARTSGLALARKTVATLRAKGGGK